MNWADLSSMDLKAVFRSQYSSNSNLLNPLIPDSAYGVVLRDADSRVNREFHIPSVLRAPVEFWLKIYTQHTTQHVVIFDDEHPEIVYEVLDFRELAKTSRNRAAYEIVSKRRTKAALERYRSALSRLAKNPRPRKLNATERRILAAIRKSKHRHSFRELASNVRIQVGQRDNVVKGLLAAEAFFPKMEQIFTSMGVPPELTRLSLVESSFNLKAVSRVGATGVWQFMLRSGKEYLTIDERLGIDERRSPLKATVAAAKLLKRNRRMLGSWMLAAISYNHGYTGLRKVKSVHPESQSVKEMFRGCSGKSGLGFASRNYYAEFLAMVHAEAYRHLFYGDAPGIIDGKAVAMERLPRAQTASQFAKARGIPLQQFQFLNPDVLDLSRKLPAGFTVAVPGERDDLAVLLLPKKTRKSTTI